MKKLFATTLLLACASVMAQTMNLKGRVLDKANMQGVPGATVNVVGSAFTATTDTAGRFVITGASPALGRVRAESGEPYFQGGALWVEALDAGQVAYVQIFGAAGESLAASRQPLKTGRNRLNPLPERDRDFVGFARIRIGGDSWIKPMLHTAGPVSGSWSARIATAARGLAKASASGQVEISADKLVKKTVPYASESANLGDIVMDYPDRKIGVGAAPIYGATVLFDGRKGNAAAAAELQAKWKDWPRFTPSDIKFRIVRDPEFPNDTNRAALQSCCNTIWGYDDIQAKVGIYADFQAHVEFIGMGEYDIPYDVAAPNPNATDPSLADQPGYINSGVYVASRFEVQIQTFSTDAANIPAIHDMGAIVNDYIPLSNQNKPNGVWQAYDITYRNARFNGATMTSNPYMSIWWNGVQTHNNRKVNAAASGLANHSGEEFLDTTLYGLKLQSEGRDVRFRNVWIKELKIADTQTNFGY